MKRNKYTSADMEALLLFLDNNSHKKYFKKKLRGTFNFTNLDELLSKMVESGFIVSELQKTGAYNAYPVYFSKKYKEPEQKVCGGGLRNVFLRKEYKPDKIMTIAMLRVNQEKEIYKTCSVNLD